MRIEQSRGYRILTVPGLRGSGPGHWQTLWERAHPDYRRVMQHNWNDPALELWAAVITREVQSDDLPALLVAHSFGCLAAMRCVRQLARGRVVGAYLVAPANPARFGIEKKLLHYVPDIPSLLVASSDDPWISLAQAEKLADAWGSHFVNIGDCGHINAKSGFGPWIEGERLLYEFHKRVSRMVSLTPGWAQRQSMRHRSYA